MMEKQSFEPFRLYVEAYGLDECGPDPAFLEVTVSPEFIGTLLRLQSLCAPHGLVSINAEDQWSAWDQENDLNLRGKTLSVYRNGVFWFEAQKKHGGNVESLGIDIKILAGIARKGPGQSHDYRFAWRDGALFSSTSSLDDLVKLVDDTNRATGVREVVDED